MRDPNLRDVHWLRPDGKEMGGEDWDDAHSQCIGMILAGDAIDEADERGNAIVDDTMMVILNAHFESIPFYMPPFELAGQWDFSEGHWALVMDTRMARRKRDVRLRPGDSYELEARSMALFIFQGVEHEEDD
jgi:glycogen operon protein